MCSGPKSGLQLWRSLWINKNRVNIIVRNWAEQSTAGHFTCDGLSAGISSVVCK